MDFVQRNVIVPQIRCGIVISGGYKILAPTIEVIIESHRVYEKAYDEALDFGLLTVEDINFLMDINASWTNKQEDILKNLQSDIEKTKLEMYKKRMAQDFLKKSRLNLRSKEAAYKQLLSKKEAFQSYSCESIAEQDRVTFILSQTSFKDGRLIDVDDDINKVLSIYNKSFCNDKDIRMIARTEPWSSIWSTCKLSNANLLFTKDNVDLTVNQKNLILWSNTYDRIRESYEPPEESVLEDDDLLDGWMLYQKEKRKEEEKEKKKEAVLGKGKPRNSKFGSAGQETFLFANDESGLSTEDIMSLNSPDAMRVMHQRFEALNSSKGSISFDQLPDQQLELQKRARQGMNERLGKMP